MAIWRDWAPVPYFIILTCGTLNFLSRMGSINSFCQAIQEILLNNYLAILGPSALIFLKFSNFIILFCGALNFLSRMGSINSFCQAIQEILLNNYLKSSFENSEIRDFVSTFCNFIRGKSFKKYHLFFEL